MASSEDQDPVHLAIGDEKAVAIVDGQAVDPTKMSIGAVLDQGGVMGLSVEDENRSHLLIGHVHLALGINGDAVWSQQLPGKSLELVERVFLLGAGHPIHPTLPLLGGCGRSAIDLHPRVVAEPADAR